MSVSHNVTEIRLRGSPVVDMLLEGAPDALGGGGHRHIDDAERGEGVEDRVHYCGRRGDGAAFADTFDAERVRVLGTELKSILIAGSMSARGSP
jgi:hypothetical protein